MTDSFATGPLHPEYTVKYIAVSVIFFNSGLSLKTEVSVVGKGRHFYMLPPSPGVDESVGASQASYICTGLHSHLHPHCHDVTR